MCTPEIWPQRAENGITPLDGTAGKIPAGGPWSEYRIEISRGTRVDGGGIDVLLQQHRQVLSNGVAEIRAEHADVVAAAITHADYGLGSELVGNAQPRSKSPERIINVAIGADISKACDTNGTGSVQVVDIGEAAVSFTVNGLGEVNLPAQAIVDGEL